MHGHFLWELTGTWSQFTKKRRIIADRRSHIILHFPWSFLMDIVTAIYWWPSPAFQRWIPERYRIWNKKKDNWRRPAPLGSTRKKKEKLAANPTIMWAGKMAAVGFRGAGALRIEWKASRRGGSIRAGSIHSDAKIAKTRNGGRPASRHFRSTWLLSTDRKQSGRKQKISRGWNL